MNTIGRHFEFGNGRADQVLSELLESDPKRHNVAKLLSKTSEIFRQVANSETIDRKHKLTILPLLKSQAILVAAGIGLDDKQFSYTLNCINRRHTKTIVAVRNSARVLGHREARQQRKINYAASKD